MIRQATPDDVPVLLQLITELAVYEREPDAVETTEAMLHEALFGPTPVASAHLAEDDSGVAGFARWFVTFSTWKGRPGLWLEDLFIRPTARGTGLGRALLQTLAQVCVEREYARFEWWVMEWNVDAQGFYQRLGATPESDWTTWRVDGAALAALAQGRPGLANQEK